MSASSSSLAALARTGREARLLMRSGRFGGHTAGMAPGHVQGNLAILPKAQADVFLRSCQRNPKPCPLLALSEPGNPALPTLGDDIDIRTNLPTVPAGIFQGPLVVAMRPMKAVDAIRAVQVTSRFPQVHGAPVHIGQPDLIGIADLDKPDFGEPVVVIDDELPVFRGLRRDAAVRRDGRQAVVLDHAWSPIGSTTASPVSSRCFSFFRSSR